MQPLTPTTLSHFWKAPLISRKYIYIFHIIRPPIITSLTCVRLLHPHTAACILLPAASDTDSVLIRAILSHNTSAQVLFSKTSQPLWYEQYQNIIITEMML